MTMDILIWSLKMKNHWIKEYNKKGLIGYLRSRYCKKQIVSNYDEDYFKSIPDNYPSEVDYVI